MKYLDHAKLDSLRNFSLSVLLISGHYLYAASRLEMGRESREALPRNGFHALRDQWNDLAQMHSPKDDEAKKR